MNTKLHRHRCRWPPYPLLHDWREVSDYAGATALLDSPPKAEWLLVDEAQRPLFPCAVDCCPVRVIQLHRRPSGSSSRHVHLQEVRIPVTKNPSELIETPPPAVGPVAIHKKDNLYTRRFSHWLRVTAGVVRCDFEGIWDQANHRGRPAEKDLWR